MISILPRLSNTHSWGRHAADLYATPTETFDKFGGKFWREILAGDFWREIYDSDSALHSFTQYYASLWILGYPIPQISLPNSST